MGDSRKALTIIELLIAIILFVGLAVVVTAVFRVVLLQWSGAEARAGIDISLDRGIEEVTRDVREANQVTASHNDEIRFTQDGSTFYIYYLYNAANTYPPAFDQSSYTLMKGTLSGTIGGTFTYGTGKIVITDVLPPPTTDLSITGNLVTIDLSVTRGRETIHSKTTVRPRNL